METIHNKIEKNEEYDHCKQVRIEGHFGFCTIWTKFCNIMKYGMNLKFETIVQIFRKIKQLITVRHFEKL